MKQYKIINAYEVLESLSDNDKFSYDTLWSLFQLKKNLQPHYDFFQERLNFIRQKFVPLADEQGQLTGKPYQDYVNEINGLENMDKDIDFEKVPIVLKEVPGFTLKTMMALEDFVDFKKE